MFGCSHKVTPVSQTLSSTLSSLKSKSNPNQHLCSLKESKSLYLCSSKHTTDWWKGEIRWILHLITTVHSTFSYLSGKKDCFALYLYIYVLELRTGKSRRKPMRGQQAGWTGHKSQGWSTECSSSAQSGRPAWGNCLWKERQKSVNVLDPRKTCGVNQKSHT